MGAAGGRNTTGVDYNVAASTVTRVCAGGWAAPPVFWWIFFEPAQMKGSRVAFLSGAFLPSTMGASDLTLCSLWAWNAGLQMHLRRLESRARLRIWSLTLHVVARKK